MNTVETFEFVCISCNLLVEQNTLSCHLTFCIDLHLLVGLLQNGMFSKVRFYYGKQDTSHVPSTQVGTPFLVLTKREVNRGGQSVLLYEPSRGKTNNMVFEQVRHKLCCPVTEDG